MLQLQHLNDAELTKLAKMMLDDADRLMHEGCEECTSDPLKFGWDWPTFAVFFHDEYVAFREVLAEGRRRGLNKRPVQGH